MNEISPFQVSMEMVNDHPFMKAAHHFSPLIRLMVRVWFYAYQFWQKTLYYNDFKERENLIRYFAAATPELLRKGHYSLEGFLARSLLLGRALIDLHSQILKTASSFDRAYRLALLKKKVHYLPEDGGRRLLSLQIDQLFKQAAAALAELWKLSNCMMLVFDALYPHPETTRFALRTGWVNLYHMQEEIARNQETYLIEIRKVQGAADRFFKLLNLEVNVEKAVSLFESSLKVSNTIHRGDRMLVRPVWWAVSEPGKHAAETFLFTLFNASPGFLSPNETFFAPPPDLPKSERVMNHPVKPSAQFVLSLSEIEDKFSLKKKPALAPKIERRWE